MWNLHFIATSFHTYCRTIGLGFSLYHAALQHSPTDSADESLHLYTAADAMLDQRLYSVNVCQ